MLATFAALVAFFSTLNLADRLAARVNAPRAEVVAHPITAPSSCSSYACQLED